MAFDAPVARPSARRLWPAYFLAILGAAAIVAGLGWQAIRDRALVPAFSENAAFQLPRQLMGRPAWGQQTGREALAAIETMHGKGFELKDAVVAHYGEATVLLAQARDEAGATAMIDAMTTRLASGASPFTPAGKFRVGDRTVYMLSGLGQTHYYWQAGTSRSASPEDPAGRPADGSGRSAAGTAGQAADKVLWLAIDPITAESGFRELIQTIR